MSSPLPDNYISALDNAETQFFKCLFEINDWKSEGESDGVHKYTASANWVTSDQTPITCSKGERKFTIKEGDDALTAAHRIAEAMTNVEQRARWDPQVVSAKVLQEYSNGTVAYIVHDTPRFVTARESVIARRTIEFNDRPADAYGDGPGVMFYSTSVEHADAAAKTSNVLVKVYCTGAYIRSDSKSPGILNVVYAQASDPGGSLPYFAKHQSAARHPQTLAALAKHLDEK